MKFKHLKNTAKVFALASIAVLTSCQTSTSNDKFGGLALYTLRDDMGKNTEATLDSVAKAGYVNVEAAGYSNGKFYNLTPENFKKLLNDKGLNGVSTHQGSATLDNIDTEIADVKAAGFTYFVIPVPPMGRFKYNAETQTMGMDPDLDFMVNFLNTVGKKCSDAGLQLLYHNHDFEFKKNENGIVPIEYFLENTDAKYVNFQMDLFWVTKAGANPIEYFEKYPGRFKLWHVKDMSTDGKFAPVGEGTIDFGKIWEKRELSGMKYYMVEQDQTFHHTPLEAIKVSHDGLQKFGFE
ncbi:sugar phosphate isomerase/epimerase family protein [Joostella sp. CR20]|uniref:sugar phosphate isomerase/epimerase family protein n=1 Tax=Joostella sp. CR20 TaxID=2804312 RepID=UPI00313AF30B